jgi:hypothetical protein
MMQFCEFYGPERQKELLQEAEQRRVARVALAAPAGRRRWGVLRSGLKVVLAVWRVII